MTFRGARFDKRAVFTSRRFLDSTDFRKATFAIAPEFHNCSLHQSTDFSGAQFMDRKGSEDVDAAMAYLTLKLAMARVRATDEEARFYGYEQQSLRPGRTRPDQSSWSPGCMRRPPTMGKASCARFSG